MRLPDVYLDCVAFVGSFAPGDDPDTPPLGGTGFFVAVQSEVGRLDYTYFVTAKHCVVGATNRGEFMLRLNNRDGGREFIRIDGGWVFHDDPTVDIAVLPLAPDTSKYDYKRLDYTVLCDAEKIELHKIGIGEELAISGLFLRRAGKGRNIPIVRFGNLAAMPSEELYDDIGLGFHGYLAEVRSIGGLSGSPVFAYLGPGRVSPDAEINLTQRFILLLGLLRGHWFSDAAAYIKSSWKDEPDEINWGIATVTPATLLKEVLYGEELKAMRKKSDDQYRATHASKTDAAFPPARSGADSGEQKQPFTKQDFEAALKKVTRKIDK
jgi:hypothetical protein